MFGCIIEPHMYRRRHRGSPLDTPTPHRPPYRASLAQPRSAAVAGCEFTVCCLWNPSRRAGSRRKFEFGDPAAEQTPPTARTTPPRRRSVRSQKRGGRPNTAVRSRPKCAVPRSRLAIAHLRDAALQPTGEKLPRRRRRSTAHNTPHVGGRLPSDRRHRRTQRPHTASRISTLAHRRNKEVKAVLRIIDAHPVATLAAATPATRSGATPGKVATPGRFPMHGSASATVLRTPVRHGRAKGHRSKSARKPTPLYAAAGSPVGPAVGLSPTFAGGYTGFMYPSQRYGEAWRRTRPSTAGPTVARAAASSGPESGSKAAPQPAPVAQQQQQQQQSEAQPRDAAGNGTAGGERQQLRPRDTHAPAAEAVDPKPTFSLTAMASLDDGGEEHGATSYRTGSDGGSVAHSRRTSGTERTDRAASEGGDRDGEDTCDGSTAELSAEAQAALAAEEEAERMRLAQVAARRRQMEAVSFHAGLRMIDGVVQEAGWKKGAGGDKKWVREVWGRHDTRPQAQKAAASGATGAAGGAKSAKGAKRTTRRVKGGKSIAAGSGNRRKETFQQLQADLRSMSASKRVHARLALLRLDTQGERKVRTPAAATCLLCRCVAAVLLLCCCSCACKDSSW